MWSRVISCLLLGAGLTACSEPAGDLPGGVSYPFQIGEPITDPAIAAVLHSNPVSDTLESERFNANLIRLNSMFPDVMADPEQAESIRREIVRQFVIERLVLAEARRNGVGVDSATIQARVDEYRSSFASGEDFKAELDRFNQSESDLESQFEAELARSAISHLVEDRTPQPDPAEVDAFRQGLAERLLVQHILFMDDESFGDDERRQLREKATAVLDSANAGVNFGMLARRHSDDRGTAQSGGELPWFRRGEMVEGFENAAFALDQPGDVTKDLVRTSYGYHVIRLVDRARDEAIPADSAAALLWRRKVREAERNLIDSLQVDAVVRVNPDLVPGIIE